MMPWALVEGGAIFELFATPPMLNPAFTVVEVPATNQVGDVTTDGITFTAPAAAPRSLAASLAVLDAMTQAHEAAGIQFQALGASAPSLMATDVSSQGKILSAFVAAGSGLWRDNTPWKMTDGSFVPFLTADAMAAAKFALDYVAGCARAEAAIAALLVNEPGLDLDRVFLWPSNGPFTTAMLAPAQAAPVTAAGPDGAAAAAGNGASAVGDTGQGVGATDLAAS